MMYGAFSPFGFWLGKKSAIQTQIRAKENCIKKQNVHFLLFMGGNVSQHRTRIYG